MSASFCTFRFSPLGPKEGAGLFRRTHSTQSYGGAGISTEGSWITKAAAWEVGVVWLSGLKCKQENTGVSQRYEQY